MKRRNSLQSLIIAVALISWPTLSSAENFIAQVIGVRHTQKDGRWEIESPSMALNHPLALAC
jgi:hypothetical protein